MLMEILSTTEHYIQFYLALSVVIVITAFCLVLGITSIVVMSIEKSPKLSDIILTVVLLCCASFFIIVTVQGINKGAEVTHKAKITDFNEVYDNGYEVVGKDGSLYIITKKNKSKIN
jgi:amino acid transporter